MSFRLFAQKKLPPTLLQRVKRRPRKRVWVMWIVLGVMVASLGVLLFFQITVWTYADGLISRDRLVNRQLRGLVMYDSDGQAIYESGVQFRSGNVPLEQIPLSLRHATVAVEDKDFYTHIGFSLPAMARAFFANTESGEIVQGASTITQQLVKNALLGDASVRYVRKIREIVLAFAIEYRYSKDELLELYLNSIYYGRGAWGAGDAAMVYFGKEIDQINEGEATFLAGLPQAPSVYGANMELARTRQQLVLRAMITQGLLDSTQAGAIYATPLTLAKMEPVTVKYPFFTLEVRRQLAEMLGVNKNGESVEDQQAALEELGLKVYTTIDASVQDLSERAVREGVAELASRRVENGAAVVLDSASGAVRAMVGSVEWNNAQFGKFNVLYSMQQPGSTLKPFIYAAAIDEGVISTTSVLRDVRTNFNGYAPENYDRRFRGNVSVKRALANSLNVPVVEVFNRLGIDLGVGYLVRAGVGSLRDQVSDSQGSAEQTVIPYSQYYGLSLVLGGYEVQPVEVAAAYGTLARGGVYQEPYLIERIVDRFGRVIYRNSDKGERVFSRQTSDFIFDALSDNQARRESFGERAENLEVRGKRVAVKTGTTTDYRDSWAVGYDDRYVVGVWVGNNDNSPMQEVAGSVGGARVWKRIFEGL